MKDREGTMKCRYCAEEIKEEAIKCKHCGEWLGDQPEKSTAPQQKKLRYAGQSHENQKAVTKYTKIALVFSLLWLAGLGSIAAIVYSNKALKVIKQSDEPLLGKGVAIFSLVLGILGCAFWGIALVAALIHS